MKVAEKKYLISKEDVLAVVFALFKIPIYLRTPKPCRLTTNHQEFKYASQD